MFKELNLMRFSFLAPATRANFSFLAGLDLTRMFGPDLDKVDLDPVESNEHILPAVIKHGGCGVVAMETEAQGKIVESVESVARLLNIYESINDCPTRIIASYPQPLQFAFMVRRGMRPEDVKEVLGHPKSYGACRANIRRLGLRFIERASNGQAAKDVATMPEFARAAALGPWQATEEYKKLIVGYPSFQDGIAVTTFYLLGPRRMFCQVGLRQLNRSLLVCRLDNRPNTFGEVLRCFGTNRINLRNHGSVFVGGAESDQFCHFECRKDQARAHTRAMDEMNQLNCVQRHLLFGPFPVMQG